MTAKQVAMTMRVEVAPWVQPYVALMVRLCQSDRFKATLSTFIIDHGVKAAAS